MKNFILSVSLFLISVTAWACPGCAGGVSDTKNYSTVWILSIFIILIYIPFYLLFRITKKFDVNKENTSSPKVP